VQKSVVVLAVNSWRLVATKEMALLIVCFAYTGINLCDLCEHLFSSCPYDESGLELSFSYFLNCFICVIDYFK